MRQNTLIKTDWVELFPYEFKERLQKNATVFLPLGICEPHGQVSAYGLDLIKAEWLCRQAAMVTGGIVAPSMGYHIHETGYHARWLEEEVGEENPRMTGVPPQVFFQLFLYQLRSFVNAGFKRIVVISGHSGGNQNDLRLLSKLFMNHFPVTIIVKSDPELVEGKFQGDHAGKYELSQLMYLRPDLVDLELAPIAKQPNSDGKLALNNDYFEATNELGKEIMESCLAGLLEKLNAHPIESKPNDNGHPRIGFDQIEKIWKQALIQSENWLTARPWSSQKPVSEQSQWKPYEYY